VRCLVEGRVQEVFYRASTVSEAVRLGLDGWVRNLPDGRVEVVASGDFEVVALFCGWLWHGPEMAEVAAVIVEEWADIVDPGFLVL
tara:strand:+ start:168 stop:425 length:258 start_codon:yes stop_codon:yes gene_type:complete